MRFSPFLCNFLAAGLFCGSLMADTYYVDYASGDDGNSGKKPGEAWKHAPGDPAAEKRVASVTLGGGDVVQFRGGVVYRGTVVVPASGEEGKPLVYKGTGWGDGRAIVDGSEIVADWKKCASAADAGGNPDFANLYYADVETKTPFELNLQETMADGAQAFLNIAQTPNPQDPFFNDRKDSFHTVAQSDLTTTSVTASEVFSSADPKFFEGASLLLWLQPNVVKRVDILSYDPAAHRVTFADVKQSSIYPDGRDQAYAIFNSPHAIDQAGEYSVGLPDASGKRRIVLWPFSAEDLDARISRSIREQAFQLGAQNHVTVEGFEIRKFSGETDAGGSGIYAGPSGKAVTTGLVVRDNVIHHNASGGRGHGGVFMTNVNGATVEKNDIQWNKNMRGIFFTKSEDAIIRNNYVAHAGRTAVVMYGGKKSLILNNRIDSILATHANALTLYIACENVVVAGNSITNSTNPITIQDSGPLYFFNNVVDGGGRFNSVDEWPNTKRGPWASGKIVFLNNTFLNSDKTSSLNVGRDKEKEYVVINNILHGMNSGSSKGESAKVMNAHNIFTGLGNFQAERYGWRMGEGEQQIEDMAALFVDPEKQDFRLKPGGPAIGAGADVSSYYPKDVFPKFNFDEFAGVTKPMNIGAEGSVPATPK